MRNVTQEMIKDYRIDKLGYDFMGYEIKNKKFLSFHHLIVPRRNCKKEGLGEGYYKWNGAILVQYSSHEYLHLIEQKDYEIFLRITSEMIDQNLKGKLDLENLKQIRDLLLYFEKEHLHDSSKKGKRLIKSEYLNERITL